MITSTITLVMHILSTSLHVFGPVSRVIQYILPYRTAMTAIKSKYNINVDTKHLERGDPLPPYNGKLRVYNMRYCPYAQRLILALDAKQLDYEVVNINLLNKPEWLTQKSAFAKVPALEVAENVCIYESLVAVEYIDEAYPQRPLLPKDLVKKAFDKIIVEAAAPITFSTTTITITTTTIFYKLIKSPETITDENILGFQKALTFIQEQLVSRGSKFLDGSEPGYADYMIWPWFERLITIADLDARVVIDDQEYKVLIEYWNNMFKDPAVSGYAVPKDILLKVMDGYKPGNTSNYDLLLKK